jgi:2',3'-cyclic-nucleotide 2'-phosphodiesterase (5'-nucleotidase family)
LVVITFMLGLLLPPLTIAQTPLTILHTSEHHGTLLPLEAGPYAGLGGVARRATLIATVRKEASNVLMVDSGDLLIGSAMSAAFRGEADIAAMNLMGYDALALGNHDFDFGLEHLMILKRQAKFPFLCTNVRPRTLAVCQRFVIKHLGPVRIALIGLIGKSNYPDTFNRDAVRDLDFQNPIEAAREVIIEVREQAELVVAITHEETEEDLALARAVPAIDVIIGGHTGGFDGLIVPSEDKPAPGRIELAGVGPVFVKTHRQGRTLGRLDLLYHDRTIMVAEARNLPVDAGTQPDQSVSQLIEHYVRRLHEETGRVIGHSAADLDGERETIRTRETNLGNLLADLARRETGAEVALINAGAVRSSLASGPVTYRRLMEVLPLDSSLAVLALTGAQLRTALEHGFSRLPQPNGRFLQISGLRLRVDLARATGARIADIQVNGNALDPARYYSVAVTRFIAEGGDGYSMLLKASNRQDFDVPLRDLLAQAVKEGPIMPGGQSRIQTEVKIK